MAEWISVYCRQPIRLDGDAIRRWIEEADLPTLAEGFYDDDESATAAADSAEVTLRVDDGEVVEVHWQESGRPLRISAGSAVTEEISEILDEVLDDAVGPGPDTIRDHLAGVRQVIHIEMSASDSLSMGAVLGEVIALELAAAGTGLVWFFGKEWVSGRDRAGTIWTGE
ncbi:hypothetical protein [Nocardia sp. NPDC057668]|uniref:hypothetical protein n=1 Tax=Nocardia sp. NPDC057668 TaxID=3346202 RepID=UPI00366E8D4E